MTDTANLALAVDTTQVGKATIDLDKLTAAGEKTEAQFNKMGQGASSWQQNMAGVDAAMRASSDRTVELALSTQRLIDRYDPLGTKLRALQSDMAAFQRAMGDSTSAAAMKTFQGLEADIERTSKLMSTAGVAGFEDMAKAADRGAFATAGAKRELMVLGHEAMTGNFSKMPGSFMVLAERMHLTSALLSPMVLGFVGLGAAAAAVGIAFYQGSAEIAEFNKNIGLTNNSAGLTRDAFNDMAASIATSSNTGLGTAKEVMQGLIATGRVSGDTFNAVAQTAVEFASRTGESSEEVVKDFSKLQDGVTKWASEHNKQYHFISTATYEHIRALEEEGKTSEAIQLTMAAMDNHLSSNAEHLSALGLALKDVKGGWSALWDTLKGALNEDTLQQTITAQAKLVTDLQDQLATGRLTESRAAVVAANLQVQMAEYVRLTTVRGIEDVRDKRKSADDAVQQAGIAASDRMKARHAEVMDNAAKEAEAVKKYWADQNALKASGGLVDNPDQQNAQLAHYHDLYAAKKQVAEATDAVAQALAKANEAADKELSIGEKLSASDKFRIEILSKLNDEWVRGKKTLDQVVQQESYLNDILSKMDRVARQREETKALEESQKAYEALISSIQKTSKSTGDSLDKAIAKQRLHNEEIGKTKSQIEAIKAAQEDADIAALQSEDDRLTKMLAQNDALKEYDDTLSLLSPREEEINRLTLDGLEAQIKKRKELRDLLNEGAAREANKAAVDAQTKEWQKGWDETDKLARTVFTDWGMQGTNMAKQIGDTLKKAIASAFYEQNLQPFVKSIYTALTGGAPGGAAGGGTGGLVNTASNLNSLYGAGMQYLTGASVGSSSAAMVGANAVGAVGGDGLGALIAGNGGWAGVSTAVSEGVSAGMGVAASEGAFAAAAGTGTAAAGTGMMAGITGALSAIPVWGWIAAALLTQLGGPKIDQVGNGLSGTLSSAGGSNLQTRTDYTEDHHGLFGIGAFTTHNSAYSDASQGTTDYINAVVATVTKATTGYAKAIGLSADAVDGYTQAIDITLTGLDAKGAQAEVTKALTSFTDGMVTAAYGGAISALAKTGETSSTTLARLATDITVVNGMFKFLGQSLLPIGIDGAKAAAGLVDAFGGLDKLQSSVSTYYNLMYSDSEKAANAAKDLSAQFAGLGLSVPDSTAAFRELVGGIDKTTASGQSLYASVINLAPAFDAVSKSAQQAAAAAQQAAAAAQAATTSAIKNWGSPTDVRNNDAANLQKTLKDSGLNVDLQTIFGATKESILAFFNSTDKATQEILRKNQQAIFDFVGKGAGNSGSQGVGMGAGSGLWIPSVGGNTPTVDPAIAEKKSLQEQLDKLTLNGIELQKKQIEAQRALIQESNKALFDQVKAAELAKTNNAIQDQIDVLKGTKTARQLQVEQALAAAGDASSQALLKVKFALEDAAAVAKANATLQDQIDVLKGTITARELALKQALAGTTDESTQALIRLKFSLEDAAAVIAKFKSATDSLASSKLSMDIQLLQLNGDNAGAAALKRASDIKLATIGFTDAQIAEYTKQYDANVALADQIKAVQAAQAAAASAAQAAAQAAAQLKNAWQSVTDGIFSEVARIRGLMGTPQQSYAQAQTAFAIAAAQASAGDQNAAKDLPRLSQNMLSLAETQARTLTELQLIRGRTAGTLEGLGNQFTGQYGLKVPSFDVGTNFVPQDMLAMVHKGEQIVPAAYNPANSGTSNSNADVVAELRAARAENADMRTDIKRMKNILINVTPKGAAIAVEVVTIA